MNSAWETFGERICWKSRTMSRYRRKKRRIIILCEGDTEVAAVDKFIKPYWQNNDQLKNVGLKAVNLSANYDKIRNYVDKYSSEHHTVAVFTLIDLYGFNRVDFSRMDDYSEKHIKAKEWICKECEEQRKLHVHFSVHETEALFYASNDILCSYLGFSIPISTKPEEINFEKSPSKRLNGLFVKHKKRRYNKGGGFTDDDTRLFEKMAEENVLEDICGKCPYFRSFINDLENTAKRFL